MNKILLSSLFATSLFFGACAQDTPVSVVDALHSTDYEVSYTITLENKSVTTSLSTTLALLAWAVSQDEGLFFSPKKVASKAFESLAEDGSPDAALAAVAAFASGHLDAPIAPGGKASFTFKARPGMKLTFSGMLVETNDLFLAPQSEHFELFDEHNEPINPGAVAIALWDAGTEVNQEPGKGADQAPRQSAVNTGESEDSTVMHADELADGFTYPEATQMFLVTLQHDHEGHDEDGHDKDEHDDHASK